MIKRLVLIVDDHPLAREGLAMRIGQQRDLAVCGEADGPTDAMQQLAKRQPDIVVMDLVLKGGNGLVLIGDIAKRYPGLPIVVLSVQNERVYAPRALRSGAKGYVMKNQAAEVVVEAIRRVLDGHVYLSPQMQSHFLDAISNGNASPSAPVECLTDRELEVYRLLGEGLSSAQIAAQLHLSRHTVHTYYERIKLRLNVSNHSALCREAVLWLSEQQSC